MLGVETHHTFLHDTGSRPAPGEDRTPNVQIPERDNFAATGVWNTVAGPISMTRCYNCGHSDSFVLLVELAFPVPFGSGDERESGRDCSLVVQCPACDSTDVGVPASELLARYASTTSS